MENKNFVFHDKLFEFSNKGVKVDGVQYYTVFDLYNLLEIVVVLLGRQRFPDVDPVYYHYHTSKDRLLKYDLIRYIRNLIYHETDEYKLTQKFNETRFIRKYCGQIISGDDVKVTIYFDDDNYNKPVARLLNLLKNNQDFSKLIIEEIF